MAQMAPHTLDTILKAPQWPPMLCDFITWCLMWDPNNRPTSSQSLRHEYFSDAYDPILPKPLNSGRVSRKSSDMNVVTVGQLPDPSQSLTSKTSAWFRKSLITRESAPAVPQHIPAALPVALPTHIISPHISPAKVDEGHTVAGAKIRPSAIKRATWASGIANYGAPMPILPSIRPISPLSNHVTAQANSETDHNDLETTKKMGRQALSPSHGVHRTNSHREDAERALIGGVDAASPTASNKEGFFAHLRKRARRISGRHQLPLTPRGEDLEANVGCAPWAAARHMPSSEFPSIDPVSKTEFGELDNVMRNLQNVSYNVPQLSPMKQIPANPTNPVLKRHHSLPRSQESQFQSRASFVPAAYATHSVSTQRIARKPLLNTQQYRTPDEQEEILNEALASAQAAVNRLDRQRRCASEMFNAISPYDAHHPLRSAASEMALHAPYPTPSTSEKGRASGFEGHYNYSHHMDISPQNKPRADSGYPFPTPPYEENEWAAAAAAAIFGVGDRWK